MNSDFWVVIATAAPVVVLTCIVLCSTQGGNLAQLFHEWKKGCHHPVILTAIIVAAVVNLVVFSTEAIAFLDALGHLEKNTNGNRGLAISEQMFCLIGLGVSSVATHIARCTWWPEKDPEPSSVPLGDGLLPAESRSIDT
jgi:hypothetical protein